MLVMPSCGFAETLRKFDDRFVSKSETIDGLVSSFKSHMQSSESQKSRSEIREFCSNVFGITNVTNDLLTFYRGVVNHIH